MAKRTIQTFRAFRNRNFSLFFTGQSISRIGTWMQRTAVIWVIYTLTHSMFMLGVTTFAEQFPSFLFSLYGGIVSDRNNRYKLLLATQTGMMVQAILLSILILTRHYIVWEILALSVMLGVINAFDIPARQPLVHEMINDEADLPNALALNSTLTNLAKLVGPALAGIVLDKFGAGICFLSNAVSFVAVITCLLLMKLPPYRPQVIKKKKLSELNEGFKYIIHTHEIGITLLILALVSFLVLPYRTLLPVFAREIFHGNAATYGYINSFIGLGAMAGAIFLASLKDSTKLKKVLFINTIILAIGLIAFSHITVFAVASIFAVITGFGAMAQTTVANIIVQVNSAKQMRGRVMSYLAMAAFGMLPLGSLVTGAVSQRIGAPVTLFCEGIIALVIALIFYNFLHKLKDTNNHSIEIEEEIVQEN